MLTKIKKISSLLIDGFYNNRYEICLSIPFLLMDLIIRIMGYKIDFFHFYRLVPNLFTIIWIMLFIGTINCLKGKSAKITYWILFIIFFALFVTNSIYYGLTSFYFSFNLLKMTNEGSSYILDTIINTSPLTYAICLAILIIAIICYRIYFKNVISRKKIAFNKFAKLLVIFILCHACIPLFLGSGNSGLQWNTFKNPRNIYENFNDSNKSMKICGIYEYSLRNFYVTFLKPQETISDDDQFFLNNVYNAESVDTTNNYTGIFKGKNVIFLQLEGMDDWLLTKKTTPNLYKLMQKSINFKDHYSLYTGGGSTFNSEFAVNTGFTTPISYIENVYSFSKNSFPHSMARLFKQQGYSVNAFHMNSGEFYSRGVNYKNWGYDNYYGLIDIKEYPNGEHQLDRELVLNETFYDKMFKQNGPFVNYLITYSPHTPFTTQKGVGKLIAQMKYENQEIPDLSEEASARLAAGETDYMIGLLIDALKDNDLYDNTVIVAFADHYLYTLNDKTILDRFKNTDNNLINHTPFFIWSSDIESKNINKVTMQMNILPTVLNLFGIEYNPNNYIGQDALSGSYDGYSFFSDYSWYNGSVYVENNKVTNKGSISKKSLSAMNEKIANLIKKNDLTLKYDYFRHINK